MLLAPFLLLCACFNQDIGIVVPEDHARLWCPLESTDEYVAMATAVQSPGSPSPDLPRGGDGRIGDQRTTLTLDWVTVDATLVEWTVDPADIPDLDARIDAASPVVPSVDAAMIREHALPDLPGCQKAGVLGPVAVDLTLDNETMRLAGTLVMVGQSGEFVADGVSLSLSGGADIVSEPMWLEQASGPDWTWVSADL